jgi:hypothetical protein
VKCSFIGKTQGKTFLWRLTLRWEDNIKMYLGQIRCKVVDWFRLPQYRV